MSQPSQEILENYVAQLMEHFDSVQITVTGLDGRDTYSDSVGAGNWHARMDSVRAWYSGQLAYQNAYKAEQGRRDAGGL